MNEKFSKYLEPEEKIEKVSFYGTLNIPCDNYKFSYLVSELMEKGVSKMRRGTLKNSIYDDELVIVNDEIGFYISCEDKIMTSSDIKPKYFVDYDFHSYIDYQEVEKDEYDKFIEKELHNSNRIKYEIGSVTDISFEEFVECLICYNITTQSEVDDIIKYFFKKEGQRFVKNNFEFKMDDKSFNLYVELNGDIYSLEIDQKNDCCKLYTLEAFHEPFTIGSNTFNKLGKAFKEYTHDYADIFLNNKVTKIENGYICNNKYYESLEDIKEDIDEHAKND